MALAIRLYDFIPIYFLLLKKCMWFSLSADVSVSECGHDRQWFPDVSVDMNGQALGLCKWSSVCSAQKHDLPWRPEEHKSSQLMQTVSPLPDEIRCLFSFSWLSS